MNILKTIVIIPIKLYQWTISPLLPNTCRYFPSCSRYTIEAVRTHGILAGLYLGMKRILRCHPWGGHGYDPVPREKPRFFTFKKINNGTT